MNTDKKSNGWILCPSKTFPGKFYYFNVLNGEVAWSLNENDKKNLKKDKVLPKAIDKSHCFPEPSSPPTEESPTIFNPVDNIMFRKPEISSQLAPRHFISDTNYPTFGQTAYPNCIPNFGSYIPNVIWAPIQTPPISQPIYVQIPPEVKTEILDETLWRPRSTVNTEKNLLIHTSTMPLNKRFANIKRTIVNDMHSSVGNNTQHTNNFFSYTLRNNAWGVPMYEESHENKIDNQSGGNKLWNTKFSAPLIKETVFKRSHLGFNSTKNDVSVTYRDIPERSEVSCKESEIPFQKSNTSHQTYDKQSQKFETHFHKSDIQFQQFDKQFQKSDFQFRKSDTQCQKFDKQCQISDIETISADIQATSKSIADLRINDQPVIVKQSNNLIEQQKKSSEELAKNDLRLVLLARKRKAEYDKSDTVFGIKNKYISPKKHVTFNLTNSDTDPKDDIIGDVIKRPKLLSASLKDDKSIFALRKLAQPQVKTDHWLIVVDAEGLLQEFEFIESYIQKDPKCRLFIPYVVKFEIETMCLGDSEGRNPVFAARQITRQLRSPSQFIVVQNEPTEGGNYFSKHEAILDCCNDLMQQNFHVVVITDSNHLQNISKCHLPCYSLREIKEAATVSNKTDFESFEIQNYQKTIENYKFQRNNNLFSLNVKEPQSFHFKEENEFKKSFFNTETEKESLEKNQSLNKDKKYFENKVASQNIFLNNNSRPLVVTKEKEIPKLNFNSKKSEVFSQKASKDHDISDTKLGKLRAAVLDLRNDIEKPDHSTTDRGASCKVDFNELATDKDEQSFCIQNDVMEKQVKERIEEWICLLTQIMEDVLSIVIQTHCDPTSINLPPPWTFHEAIQCINKIFVHNDVIRDETEKLSNLLFNFSCKKGKLRSDIKTQDLMKIIKCSVNLIRNLKDTISNCIALSDAEDLILQMVNSMERPIAKTDIPRTPKVLKSLATYEDDIRSLPEHNLTTKHSEILKYLQKHYPVWKYFEGEKKYEEETTISQRVQDNAKVIRTVGGNLSMLKINSKKTIQLNDFKVIESQNTDSSENDLNVPIHGNTFDCEDKNNKPKVTRNIRIIPAFESKLLEKTVPKISSKVLDFTESISSTSNIGSQIISNIYNEKLFRNFSKINNCDQEDNAVNNNCMDNNDYSTSNNNYNTDYHNSNSCNTVEKESRFCKDSDETTDIELARCIFDENEKKPDEPHVSSKFNSIPNNLKRQYWKLKDNNTFDNTEINTVLSNNKCRNITRPDGNQSETKIFFNHESNKEDKLKSVHFVQETNDRMAININNDPKAIKKIQLINNYELGTPFYFSDISADTISNEVETVFKKQTILEENSSSGFQRKSEDNANKTANFTGNTNLNDSSKYINYNKDNNMYQHVVISVTNNDKKVKNNGDDIKINGDYTNNKNNHSFTSSQSDTVLKTTPTNESTNDKVESENLQAYDLVRTFLIELSGTFKVIYKFLEESIKECQRKNMKNDKKQQINRAASETQLLVLEIMVKLKSIIQRESNEETSAKSMILKCGVPASEDKRITRYLQVITKCLEQAEILEKALKILLEVTKENFNVSSLSSWFDNGVVKYFNIFE